MSIPTLPVDPECLTKLSRWAETFLVHPETGEPLKLHQVERDLLDEQEARCVTRLHRRMRTTNVIALKALGSALLQQGTRVLVYTPGATQLGHVMTRVRALIERNEWLAESRTRDRQSPLQWIEFSNGSVIQGVSVSRHQGQLRGIGANRGFVDGAQDVSEPEWQSLLPCVTAGTLEVFGVPPPGPTHSTFFRMCTDPQLRNVWKRRHIPFWDNPDVVPIGLCRMRQSCGIDMWRAEWLAEFHPQSYDLYLDLPQPTTEWRPSSKTRADSWMPGCRIRAREEIITLGAWIDAGEELRLVGLCADNDYIRVGTRDGHTVRCPRERFDLLETVTRAPKPDPEVEAIQAKAEAFVDQTLFQQFRRVSQ